MEIVLLILALCIFWSIVMLRTNKGAKLSLAWNKGLMFGFTSSRTYYELENETDEYFQVGLGFVILTVVWTYSDQ